MKREGEFMFISDFWQSWVGGNRRATVFADHCKRTRGSLLALLSRLISVLLTLILSHRQNGLFWKHISNGFIPNLTYDFCFSSSQSFTMAQTLLSTQGKSRITSCLIRFGYASAHKNIKCLQYSMLLWERPDPWRLKTTVSLQSGSALCNSFKVGFKVIVMKKSVVSYF